MLPSKGTTTTTPKLWHQFSNERTKRSVQLWTTSCIVTNFGRGKLRLLPSQVEERKIGAINNATNNVDNRQWLLINPSNPSLSGCSKFPYFPRGGPVPVETVTSAVHRDWQPLGYVSQWGGMEVGNGMMYSVSVVDGLTHLTGGWKLQAEIQWLRIQQKTAAAVAMGSSKTDELCPIGTAVKTSAGSESLSHHYDAIVHTTPPFYKHDANPNERLLRCYESALALAFRSDAATTFVAAENKNNHVPVVAAVPLVGSGARGFPNHVACQVAADAMVQWLKSPIGCENNSSLLKYSSSSPCPGECANGNEQHQWYDGSNAVVAFGLLDQSLADELALFIETASLEGQQTNTAL